MTSNEFSLFCMSQSLLRGCLVFRDCEGSYGVHEGIYIGYGKVVEVSSETGKNGGGNETIRVVSLSSFENGRNFGYQAITHTFPLEQVARRAESKIGTKWYYSRFNNNCQSFTSWCYSGVQRSWQTTSLFTVGGMAVGAYNNGLVGGIIGGILSYGLAVLFGTPS